MSRLTDVNLTLLVKLGSLAVHAEEILDQTYEVNHFDKAAIRTILDDPEFAAWRKQMDAAGYLPKKRSA